MLKICDTQQFMETAKDLDGILCYGAGEQMKSFLDIFQNSVVVEKCIGVADRDIEKQGKKIQVGKAQVPIISPEDIKMYNEISCAIIITCTQYEEILNYFEKDDILRKMDYYCLYYFQILPKDTSIAKRVPSDFKIYEKQVIPKIIHYFWFGNNPLPEKYKAYIESWKKFCPDYEIKEWNESNYDISKNRYMKQAYDTGKWGFVPDYARLDIIYRYGGIYLDTDVELIANIDDMLYQDGFLGFESETRINCGMGFGAVQGLKIIKEMRDDYNNKEFIKKDGELDLTPSPDIQSSFLKKRGLVLNGEYQTIEGLTVYPEKVLGGKNLITRRINILPCTRAIHHFDGSWLDDALSARVNRLEEGILLEGKNV